MFVFYAVNKLAWLYRYCQGNSLLERLSVLVLHISLAFENMLPSPVFSDIGVGLAGAVLLKGIVYVKGKNAKKFRQGVEYGSARWGTAIMYTQLFNLLCDRADDVHGGRLPYHVRLLLDEFANIGQIPKFDKLIATIRSREISASIILQSQSQLKTIYKDTGSNILWHLADFLKKEMEAGY